MQNKHMNSKKVILFLAVLLISVTFACRTLSPASPSTSLPTVVEATVAPVVVQQPEVQVAFNEDTTLANLYALVNPSVVNITIYTESTDNAILPSAQGSGFVYDGNGHVVTNAHVVEGAAQIDIIFSDGIQRSADVVGADPHSDLAVVQVNDMPADVNPLPLGSMEGLIVGQSVVAIGNPFGYQGTLTRGIISGLGRTIPALTVFSIPSSIQTDAAINPGNSGGPLLNLNGEVIGINDQIETSDGNRANSGVGFAIPVNLVKLVVPALIETGTYEWPWLGVRGSSLDLGLIKAMGLPVEKGAYLWQIVQDGPADKAGLKGAKETVDYEGRPVDVGGDVITAVDGQPVESFDDLLVYIALQTKPGQEVTFSIIRDGKTQDVKVTVEARPENVE